MAAPIFKGGNKMLREEIEQVKVFARQIAKEEIASAIESFKEECAQTVRGQVAGAIDAFREEFNLEIIKNLKQGASPSPEKEVAENAEKL